MQPSPPRLPLVVEVLCTADAAYGLIEDIQKMAVDGRKEDALHMLAFLAEAAVAHRPLVRGVISAQRQAAEMGDAAERTASTVARVLRFQAQEHLHAANDKTQPPTPQQPSPSVA